MPDYLTEDEIRDRLKLRKGKMPLEQFRQEIERLTGMTISYSHLANILRGKSKDKSGRAPNGCVLRYLGGSKDRVYQIDRPATKGRK